MGRTRNKVNSSAVEEEEEVMHQRSESPSGAKKRMTKNNIDIMGFCT
jgi:hypothetical protein